MRAYGVNRLDRGCCPGHDLFPVDTYRNRRSIRARARDKKLSHRLARHRANYSIKIVLLGLAQLCE